MTKKKNDVWVSPKGDEFVVHRANSSRASRVVPTQSEANNIGRRIAKRDNVDLITQGRDGRIVSHDSYGNDPCPPKDTEH